jgi:hypothetical protein
MQWEFEYLWSTGMILILITNLEEVWKLEKIKSEVRNWANLVLQWRPVSLNDRGPTHQRPEHAPFRLFTPPDALFWFHRTTSSASTRLGLQCCSRLPWHPLAIKGLALASKLPFSSFLCRKTEPPPIIVRRWLAEGLAHHSSIPLAHMIASSSRSFCPCFCSSSATYPPSTPDLTIDLLHPPVSSFLHAPCRRQALPNVLGVLVQLLASAEGLHTDPEPFSTTDAIICNHPNRLAGENFLPGCPVQCLM